MRITHLGRSFRLVCEASQRPIVIDLLEAQGFTAEETPFSPLCQNILNEPFNLGASLASFFGYIYIQDRSSMLPPLALNPLPMSFVLDMCASPGSKTSFLSQLVGPAGMTLANEPNRRRLATLAANMERLNLFSYGLCSHDGSKIPLPEASIPQILLDPPCSGWGTIDKNPGVIKIWKGNKIEALISLQRALLAKANNLLAAGGRLVYSTCTTNPQENQEQIDWAVREFGLNMVNLRPFPGFIFNENLLQKGMLLVDGKASGSQGFFIACLEKRGHYVATQIADDKQSSPDIPLPGPGKAVLYGDMTRYIPVLSNIYLPPGFSWKAPPLGKWLPSTGFTPIMRARYPQLFQDMDISEIIFEDIGPIIQLLKGHSIKSDLKGKNASIWWKDLPLGFVSIKNGRIISHFH